MPPSGVSPRVTLLVLSKHGRRGASSRLRILDLLPGLAGHGIDATVRPLLDDTYVEALNSGRRVSALSLLRAAWQRLEVLARARAWDVVWIEKEALPFAPAILEAAALRGTRFVVDISEAQFLRYRQHRRRAVRLLLGQKLEGLVRRATLTTVGNRILESWAHAAGARNVLLLPTPIDVSRYGAHASATAGPMTIGWIGSASTVTYLRPLVPLLADLIGQGAVRLHVVGVGADALPGLAATHFAWDERTEAARLSQCDVGIVPLGQGAWEQAKSPYKLLQYMATGLAVVGSPVGTVGEIIRHGVNGFLAGSESEWRAALEALGRDPALRRRLGAEARRTVEAQYGLDVIVPTLAKGLRHVAGEHALSGPNHGGRAATPR